MIMFTAKKNMIFNRKEKKTKQPLFYNFYMVITSLLDKLFGTLNAFIIS